MTIEQQLRAAIEEQRVVELAYERSGARGVRVFHPHILFFTSTGKVAVDGLQVAGDTTGAHLPEWRQFDVDGIPWVRPLERRFVRAREYNPKGKKYAAGIIARI